MIVYFSATGNSRYCAQMLADLLEGGILNGAMDQTEADKVLSLIPDVHYRRIDALHVIHLDKPRLFPELLEGFFLPRSQAEKDGF